MQLFVAYSAWSIDIRLDQWDRPNPRGSVRQ